MGWFLRLRVPFNCFQARASGAAYRLPGEYDYDGMVMDHGKKIEQLEYIRHELSYREDDVICAGFPKSGTNMSIGKPM